MHSSNLQVGEQRSLHENLASAYLTMKERVVRSGHSREIDWQEARSLSDLSESQFLAEGAWVILSSGMRERVIAQRYPLLSEAFRGWASAELIMASRRACEQQARSVFNNRAKIEAIGSMCEQVYSRGFHSILKRIREEGAAYLETFKYIGPVTSFHLAKNIGLDVVKPDRHLVRMAAVASFTCPEELCHVIAKTTGERISVVDLVLWRYAILDPEYENLLREDI